MAHVQPENIRSFLDQLPQHVTLLSSRAEGADDFGFTHPLGGLNLTGQKQGAFGCHC